MAAVGFSGAERSAFPLSSSSFSFWEGLGGGRGSREKLAREAMGEDGELWDDSALVGAFDDDIATDKVRSHRLLPAPVPLLRIWCLARRC
jgi:hypothetical protein